MEAQIDYILFLHGLALIVVAAASFALHRTPKAVLSWQLLGLFGSLYGLNVWLETLPTPSATLGCFRSCGWLWCSWLCLP